MKIIRFKQIQKKFTKNIDISDESGNLEMQKGQINDYKDLIVNSCTKSRQQEPRVIDNKKANNVLKGIYHKERNKIQIKNF